MAGDGLTLHRLSHSVRQGSIQMKQMVFDLLRFGIFPFFRVYNSAPEINWFGGTLV